MQHLSPPHSPLRQTLPPPKHYTATLALPQFFSISLFGFFLDTEKHRSNDSCEAADLRQGNHQPYFPLFIADSPLPFAFWKQKPTPQIDKLCRGLTSRRDFLSNPVWMSLENTLVRFFKLFRDILVHCLPDLVKVGCSFNLGDIFPKFSVRVVSFRLILGYHWPPNCPEEGCTLNARGTTVDGAWSTSTST